MVLDMVYGHFAKFKTFRNECHPTAFVMLSFDESDFREDLRSADDAFNSFYNSLAFFLSDLNIIYGFAYIWKCAIIMGFFYFEVTNSEVGKTPFLWGLYPFHATFYHELRSG